MQCGVLLIRVNVCLFSSEDDDGRLYNRRYWNDEWEACIFKYCMDIAGYEYMKCMNKHCRGALVQVPRDVDSQEEPSVGHQVKPTGVQLICAGLLCQHVTSAHQLVSCFRSKCLDGELNVLATAAGVLGQKSNEGSQSELADIASELETTGLCAFLRCGSRHGADYMECVTSQCRTAAQHEEKIQQVKRRVNNPMVGMVECTKQCSDTSNRIRCIKSCQT